jgi:ribosomal protein S21
VKVWVNSSINSALLMLKRKLSRKGVFGKLQERARFIKPGDKLRHERQRAERHRERTERRRQVSL